MQEKILLTGVTGTVGSAAIEFLLAANANTRIRIGVRDLGKISNAPWINDVDAVLLDYEKPETIKKALTNIDRLFLVTPPGTYQEGQTAQKILDCADSSLKHIVRLSGIHAEKHNLFANHHAADNLLMSSTIPYTALQPNTYMQNFYNYSDTIKEQHKIIEPAGIGKTSFIDARDVGAVAATILTEPNHDNKMYVLTGSEALDYSQVAAIFSDSLSFVVNYEPLFVEKYLEYKVSAGMPAEFVKKSIEYLKGVENGEYAEVSSAVETILKRSPMSLKQFVSDNKNKFI